MLPAANAADAAETFYSASSKARARARTSLASGVFEGLAALAATFQVRLAKNERVEGRREGWKHEHKDIWKHGHVERVEVTRA